MTFLIFTDRDKIAFDHENISSLEDGVRKKAKGRILDIGSFENFFEGRDTLRPWDGHQHIKK